MQFFEFVFLQRNWKEDQKRLGEALSLFAKRSDPLWLLLFPEGTIPSSETVAKSSAYAQAFGLEVRRKTRKHSSSMI